MSDRITFSPIGIIRTPFKKTGGMPIQPRASQGAEGTIELKDEFVRGLKDLDGFSHVILLYHFHLSEGYELSVTPFLDTQFRGIFATRAPRRPNGIGLSVVKLLSIEENVLHVKNVDMVDGTPLLDIKPYIGDFDKIQNYKTGWISGRAQKADKIASDNRFNKT